MDKTKAASGHIVLVREEKSLCSDYKIRKCDRKLQFPSFPPNSMFEHMQCWQFVSKPAANLLMSDVSKPSES